MPAPARRSPAGGETIAARDDLEWCVLLLGVRTGWSRAEALCLTLRRLMRQVQMLTPKKD